MYLPLYFTIPSAVIVVVSVPVYLILLVSQWKYRQKRPFTSAFFRISFHLGLFDFLHLFNDWIIGMLPYTDLQNFINAHSNMFAKQFSLLWWYSAMGQKLCVLLLAIDRLTKMWFGYVSAFILEKRFSEKQIRLLLSFSWTFSTVVTVPQLFFSFDFNTFNGIHGIMLDWTNDKSKLAYFCFCFILCVTVSLFCSVSYGLTFYKLYRHTATCKNGATQWVAATAYKSEAKLAVAGFILFFITFCCGVFCGALVTVTNLDTLPVIAGIQQLLFDIYCCISPYLILACSTAARVHFKAVLFCKSADEIVESRFIRATTTPTQFIHQRLETNIPSSKSRWNSSASKSQEERQRILPHSHSDIEATNYGNISRLCFDDKYLHYTGL